MRAGYCAASARSSCRVPPPSHAAAHRASRRMRCVRNTNNTSSTDLVCIYLYLVQWCRSRAPLTRGGTAPCAGVEAAAAIPRRVGGLRAPRLQRASRPVDPNFEIRSDRRRGPGAEGRGNIRVRRPVVLERDRERALETVNQSKMVCIVYRGARESNDELSAGFAKQKISKRKKYIERRNTHSP